MPERERTCSATNRMRESRSYGSVRDGDSNVPVYSEGELLRSMGSGAGEEADRPTGAGVRDPAGGYAAHGVAKVIAKLAEWRSESDPTVG
jgi:hypothetical protein